MVVFCRRPGSSWMMEDSEELLQSCRIHSWNLLPLPPPLPPLPATTKELRGSWRLQLCSSLRPTLLELLTARMGGEAREQGEEREDERSFPLLPGEGG